MLRNAVEAGVSKFPGKNVTMVYASMLSLLRGVANLQGKKCHVTLEWPPKPFRGGGNFLVIISVNVQFCRTKNQPNFLEKNGWVPECQPLLNVW